MRKVTSPAPRWHHRHRILGLVAMSPVAILALTGCARNSALNPKGYAARQVTGLWWWLFWVSLGVWLITTTLVLWALIFRRRRGRVRTAEAGTFVAIAGIALPLLVLIGVYAISVRTQLAIGALPGGDRGATRLEVIGHRWWWEVRYPATGAVTANEIHIPVRTPIRVRLTTADVIHSFWVPQLAPKTDAITGKANITWLRADEVGSYPGRCAEYCGLQHAMMGFLVVAEPAADYHAWLRHITAPAPAPATPDQAAGLGVFEHSDCASCHTINGTTAAGKIGPNLTTIGSRWRIGAGALPNTIGNLGGWISNSQAIKPGNSMPPQPLAAGDLQALLAYLESLK